MKNVIYFCIGFMLLLIYRKYQERMGNISAKKPENGNFGSGKELSKFRVYDYVDNGNFAVGLKHISGKKVTVENLRTRQNMLYSDIIFKVVHNFDDGFYKVYFTFNDDYQDYYVTELDKNYFVVNGKNKRNFDITITITERS